MSHMTSMQLLTAKAIANRLLPGHFGRPVWAISQFMSLPAQSRV